MNNHESKGTSFENERLTRKQKEANDFKWYKEKAQLYSTQAMGSESGYGGISEEKRMQVSYDLFNNK